MIEVTNLTKRYGSHVAVDHLSFRVEKGQIYGFLGPNGAGKSTTMNMLTGYLAASEGNVTIDGKDIQKEPEEAKKKIGYLPEIPPLYTEMTVEEYLSFAAELKKLPRAERKEQIAQVMELTQITDMRGRLIRNLSKGYRQRVGLAQAILGNPEVIILDEPSVGLDPKQIIEIRDLIRKLGENHTIILSSHILSEVSAICDHIMIIAHGRLVASDSPEGLQKLMTGSMELQLVVKGEKELVQSVLEKLPHVETVEKQEEKGDGCVKVKVISKDNADIREEIFFALADAKLPIMEMHPDQKSLEDIFLELTEDVKPAEKEKGRLFGGRRAKKAESEEQETKEAEEEESRTEEPGNGEDKTAVKESAEKAAPAEGEKNNTEEEAE